MFDPFLGTGTTIDASIQLHRFGIGCEIDKECCKVISERLWNTAEKMVQQSNNYYLFQNNQNNWILKMILMINFLIIIAQIISTHWLDAIVQMNKY